MTTNHNGANWTPTNGETLTGEHTNVGTFTITAGYTCHVASGVPLKVYAKDTVITGVLNGTGRGYNGGSVNGSGGGPGGGGNGTTNVRGAGGGAYGGDGGDGQERTNGGTAYGDSDGSIIQMGSGGGGGGSGGGGAAAGGNGGGAIFISSNTIGITGTIQGNGNGGGSAPGAGAGGAGGGLLLICHTLTCTAATITLHGGVGGTSANSADAGGGGGGRAKYIYSITDVDPKTKTTVTGGAGGTASGGAGSIGTEDTEPGLGKSDATHTVGQTINFNIPGSVVLTKVILKASAQTSGSHTLTIWDSPDKVIDYGSIANTIDTTNDETWTFTNPLELPDGEIEYYFELTRVGGDCTLYYDCVEPYSDGYTYCNGEVIDGVDLYMKLYVYSHVTNPQVYNTSDRDMKCDVAGKILTGAIHRVNSDGTGSISYADDISTSKYIGDRAVMTGVTYDDPNNELDIASDGYIYYKIDCKYPIVGIPLLDARIDIDTGTPTIQIARDLNGVPETWYTIQTAIVDNVDTEYELLADLLKLEGKSIIYVRFDFAAATGSIVSFGWDVELNTSSAQVPVVDVTGVSTFRCDQADSSSLDCTTELIYPDVKY